MKDGSLVGVGALVEDPPVQQDIVHLVFEVEVEEVPPRQPLEVAGEAGVEGGVCERTVVPPRLAEALADLPLHLVEVGVERTWRPRRWGALACALLQVLLVLPNMRRPCRRSHRSISKLLVLVRCGCGRRRMRACVEPAGRFGAP